MILYKHLSINDKTIESLKGNYIWFSSCETFNDPYDCKVRLAPVTDSDIQFIYHNRPLTKNLDRSTLLEFIGSSKKVLMDEYTKEMGVSCFTSDKNNILMWSHYSNKHSGISLGFETEEMAMKSYSSSTKKTDLLLPKAVKYSSSYPEISLPLDRNGFDFSTFFKKIFLTKAGVWSYECEYRYISFEKGKHIFNKSSLKEVIFGVNTAPNEKNQIIDLVNSLGYINVKFFDCKLNPSSYLIDIEPLKI